MKSKSEMIEESKIQNSSSLFSINEANTLLQQEENYYHVNKFVGIDQSNFKVMHKKLGLHKRSITPDTLREVKFEKSEEDLYYTEYYKCDSNKDNGVMRFAINLVANKNIIEDCLANSIGTYEKTEDDKSLTSQAYNKIETKNYISNELKHSLLEKKLVQQGIDHLLNNKDVNVVLVDILERSISVDKITLENGVVQTHTVLLYKNPADNISGLHEIVVIDPSNFFFSSHLSNKDILSNIKHDLLDTITTKHIQTQIYTPKGETGYFANQWRDCIDVAVKLAFIINDKIIKGEIFDIQLNNIQDYEFVQMISNDPNVDRSIKFKNTSIRIKQGSVTKVVKKFFDIEKFFDKNLQILKEAASSSQDVYLKKLKAPYEKIYKNYNETYKKCLDSTDNYNLIIETLLKANNNMTEELTNILSGEQSYLAGGEHD